VADGDFSGTEAVPEIGIGDPDGRVWAPAETDMPNRYLISNGGGWFWRAGEDDMIFEPEELLERYYTSVGCNTNLLIGMVIDDRGLVPGADAENFARFGEIIKDRFGSPVAETAGEGSLLELNFEAPAVINHVVIMEDISLGERIREYEVEGRTPDGYITICRGISVGHKRIERVKDVEVTGIRLKILKSADMPVIRKLAAYKI
jgi:alpha-L-fucosidase